MSVRHNGNTLLTRGFTSINLTKAEYDALPDSKLTDGVYYNITDDSIVDSYVETIPQELTDTQKTQARTNIGIDIINSIVSGSSSLVTSDAIDNALSSKLSVVKSVSGNLKNSYSISDLSNGVYIAVAQDLYHNYNYFGACLFAKYSSNYKVVNFATSEISFTISSGTISSVNTSLYLYHLRIIKVI